MKPQQTLNDSKNWRMKVLTETQPLIQSVLVKHKHPVLAFKKAKAIIKIYKCNKRLTMLHRKKL